MKEVQEHIVTINGMNVHIVPTDKYKTNTLVLLLKAPLSKDTVTKRAIIPHVLQSGTEKSPSRQQIRNRLDEMYGATLTVDVNKKGEHHVIAFRMDVTNEKFLNDSTPLTEQALALLAEVLLNPKVEGEGFESKIVEGEKRSLKQRIQSVVDDKMRYANVRLTEEMCKEEPFGLSVYGDEQAVDGVTASGLYEYYQQLLTEDAIDFYIVGDVDEKEIKDKVSQQFNFPKPRELAAQQHQMNHRDVKEEHVVFEKQDVKQGKLNIGFRTHTTFADQDYYALQLFNGLFGGFSHSKLFINVREKESLAYYAASRYESHKGILMVMSGIEFANYEKAVSIIKEQLDEMRKGSFTDGEIAQTKAVIKNQILETVDMPKGLVELLYHNEVSGTKREIKDWLAGIDSVTSEDIVGMANKIQLDTIYFLKGQEGE
ncbi:EF-P 5-aminopentanol modification-associated protein YfmF [Desertibacillus haloalkaliphilus]|uniref:EF-P 5-aminopentanol modification-associated protein YfmF n=1 Tax=Desertibacillus haloalkaliphilus TaxID=1328930 RepID=UPI001C2540D7|nr:pitrilysin family protein [Desertibacillus haloalkaliphilus]MBU8907357.1 insulinase family protein [Desertibacillus haloalkaliphilus]